MISIFIKNCLNFPNFRKLRLNVPDRSNVRLFTSSSLSNNQPYSTDLPLSTKVHKHSFSVAPMVDYTNRYQRYFQRLLTKHAIIYTEMIVSTPILRNEDPTKYCQADFNVEEPVVAQIGGYNPDEVKRAVQWMTNYGTFTSTLQHLEMTILL